MVHDVRLLLRTSRRILGVSASVGRDFVLYMCCCTLENVCVVDGGPDGGKIELKLTPQAGYFSDVLTATRINIT